MTIAAVTLNFLVMGPAVVLLNLGLVAVRLAWLANGSESHTPHRLLGPTHLLTIPMLLLHSVEEYSGRLYKHSP